MPVYDPKDFEPKEQNGLQSALYCIGCLLLLGFGFIFWILVFNLIVVCLNK